jgi:transcriptional regulator with PAS, ATPase and Fis domain
LPLRDPRRLADIEPLLGHYLAKHERGLGKRTRGLTRQVVDALLRFSWPGNVRQLSNVCLRLVTHAPPGGWIELAAIERHQPDVVSGFRDSSAETYLEDEAATYDQALRMFRRALILDRLRRYGNNAVEAAASLKLPGSTFYRYWAEARRPR